MDGKFNMQIKATLLNTRTPFRAFYFSIIAALVVSAISIPSVPAQTIKRNPDGTVEVSDDDVGPPQTHSSAGHHASSQRAGSSRKAVRTGSGRIPAYTKKMGGCTVHRHADGTIDVVDDTENAPPSRHRSASGGHRSGTTYGNGQAITRHPDGTVDVRDTTMSSGPVAHRGGKGTIGSYKHNYSDVSVKRNADGTVDVVDTSPTTHRK